jgi:hypothetical protein
MSRHASTTACKTRTSAQAIGKDFPHIVQMIVPLGGFGKKLDDMYDWHWAKDTEAMRGNGWRDDSGRFYVRWAYETPTVAQRAISNERSPAQARSSNV